MCYHNPSAAAATNSARRGRGRRKGPLEHGGRLEMGRTCASVAAPREAMRTCLAVQREASGHIAAGATAAHWSHNEATHEGPLLLLKSLFVSSHM